MVGQRTWLLCHANGTDLDYIFRQEGMKAKTDYPLFAIVPCVAQTLDALAWVHSLNILHCDIRPAFIFPIKGSPTCLSLTSDWLSKTGSHTESLLRWGSSFCQPPGTISLPWHFSCSWDTLPERELGWETCSTLAAIKLLTPPKICCSGLPIPFHKFLREALHQDSDFLYGDYMTIFSRLSIEIARASMASDNL